MFLQVRHFQEQGDQGVPDLPKAVKVMILDKRNAVFDDSVDTNVGYTATSPGHPTKASDEEWRATTREAGGQPHGKGRARQEVETHPHFTPVFAYVHLIFYL